MKPLDASQFSRGLTSLATVPENIRKIQALLNDPEASIEQLAHRIAREPVLTALLLKMANSPLYGMRNQISSIAMALIVVGIQNTAGIVQGICLFSSMRKAVPARHLRQLIQDAVGLATLCSLLTRKLGLQFRGGEDYLAGLLCDIGFIAIGHVSPEHFFLLEKQGGLGTLSCEAEHRLVGIDHCRAGEFVCEAWDYPAMLIHSVRDHHNSSAQDNTPSLPGLVRLAVKINLMMRSKELSPTNDNLFSRGHFASGFDLKEITDHFHEMTGQIEELADIYCDRSKHVTHHLQSEKSG